ncbi:MAG: hypothetical protein M1438_11725 [Deltaproteobacteria bacterium]|nr:hypothetical protein [Deltaproteobacteria bacterium]
MEKSLRLKAWLVMLLLILLPAVAYGQDQHEALVQELYIKSGLEKQMRELPASLQAGLDQPPITGDRLIKPDQQVIMLMKALAPEAFAPELLKEEMLPEFRTKLTTGDLKTILKWLNSPLGMKCTRLEEEASTPEAYIETKKYGESLKKSPPTAKRLRLIQKFDAAVQATKNSVSTFINIQTAVSLGINASLPSEQQQSLADIRREVNQSRPEIEANMKLETLMSLLYTYRNLTGAEIGQYIKFASSKAGVKYRVVTDNAWEKALIHGGIRWGKAVGEAMKQVDSQADV